MIKLDNMQVINATLPVEIIKPLPGYISPIEPLPGIIAKPPVEEIYFIG